MNHLIIFIDSFAADYLKYTYTFKNYGDIAQVIPGIGYSINNKAELLCGQTPDDVGYFCEWVYDPSRGSSILPNVFFNALESIKNIDIADKTIHRLVSKISGHNIYRIPLGSVGWFKHSGFPPYDNKFKGHSIFQEFHYKKYLYSQYISNQDRNAVSNAKKAIRKYGGSRNYFVATAELDHITHLHGTTSTAVIEKIKVLEDDIKELLELYLISVPNGKIIIFSDHGMIDVTDTVEIRIEEQFGKAMPEKYVYFLDSTFVRVWTQDKNLEEEITGYLNETGSGRVLSGMERGKYGVSDRRHGDIIFMVNGGTVVSPSFFGSFAPKAMHGYEPELAPLRGICIANVKLEKDEYRSPDIYHFLKQVNVGR